MQSKKSREPKTVPSGTSDVTFLRLDEAPSHTTVCILGLRKMITMIEVGL